MLTRERSCRLCYLQAAVGAIERCFEPAHTLHGPYRLNAITSASFRECAVNEAIEAMRRVAARHSDEDAGRSKGLSRAYEKRRAPPATWTQGVSAPRRGFVIDDFTEFVFIDDATAEFFLVVAGEGLNSTSEPLVFRVEAGLASPSTLGPCPATRALRTPHVLRTRCLFSTPG
jgi:hypothetical protein